MYLLRFWLRREQSALQMTRGLTFDLGKRMRRVLLMLLALAAAHVAAMMAFEGLSLGDAAWLTLTTLTTVGYGDLSAATAAGRTATVLLLYLAGISMLAQLASDYIDYRMERRQKMLEGRWNWNMQDHMLIVNAPKQNGQRYCELLIQQLRATPAFADLPVQLLTEEFGTGLPESLRELGVVHRHEFPGNEGALEAAGAARARYVVVLAHDHYDRRSDSLTLDIVHRLRELTVPERTYVIAEAVDDDKRRRLRAFGADSVIRPIRAYPELVVRAIVAPGVEQMMENLFTHEDDYSQRYDLDVRNVRWADVVSTLIQRDWGTAVAYIADDGSVVCNPPALQPVDAKGLILLVRAGYEPKREELSAGLAALATS